MLPENTKDTDTGTTSVEQLPYGTDPTELFADRTIKEKIIVFNDKQWVFKYRELTWAQLSKLSENSTNVSERGVITFNVVKYNDEYLTETIVKAPFPLNRASLTSFSKDFGRILYDTFVEMPTLGEQESKNLSEPSMEDGPTMQPQE
ncbi:MAG: hypothetical protein ACT6FG_00175 [Methanosarcinaceae archaeon]